MPSATREQIADKITELLIEHFTAYGTYDPNLTLPYFQKVVRDGRVQVATIPHRTDGERLVLYRSDVKGNEEDIELLNYIYNNYFADGAPGGTHTLSDIQLYIDTSTVSDYNDITTLIVGTDIIDVNNGSLTETFYQDNLGQFVDFFETHSNIDVVKAAQILDTNIYELYPSELTKQQRINRFFQEYEKLKPPSTPVDEGALISDGGNPDLTDTYVDDASDVFHWNYDIAGAPIDDEEEKFITWRQWWANQDPDNVNKSLEYIYEDLQSYYFAQEPVEPDIIDERPKYRSRSSGYLKVRTLNQAIVVRNEESSDIGLIGPDEENPIWRDTGFTITMWVRFLDKVNGGTLFNFGNPLRNNDPKGFMLETFVEEFEFGSGEYPPGFFTTSAEKEDVERFVRLVVRDSDGIIRDSHVGNPWNITGQAINHDGTRTDMSTFENQSDLSVISPFNYTRIPIDLREWYFIVATYDPNIDEDGSDGQGHGECVDDPDGSTPACDHDPDFWRGNIDELGYTPHSGFGAKCKVEIISRTDLLRARGFKE